MFNALKNFKEKYQNSSSWGEFFASYLIDLDDIYKRLEGKTEKQQIEILKRALEDQTKKTKELIGEVSKQKEAIEELTNENQELKKMVGRVIDMRIDTSGIGKKIERINTLIEINKNK